MTALPPLGFLAVEVTIHRPPGDPFNPQTWPFPLLHETVPGSTESQIVTKAQYDDAFIERFVAAGKRLAKKGAVGIITSCGFLAMAQQRLAERLPVPIATSALLQIPSIRAFLPARQSIGVLTYDGARLGTAHLEQLGIDPTLVCIRGMPANGHLRAVIQNGAEYDELALEREMVDEATALLQQNPNIGALVLECTQMPPFAEAIQRAAEVPVYDVYTMGMWFYSGLVRRTPGSWNKIE
ncbi:hypothetical protein K505DRAFT_295997 [Melanomma pulvis-pyrius CBS 109.77]|uniref:Aspartate/glutamate racemase family protein n=1 Tax=Melanomma pulvis-pyrius CBS 109.77 TaxID=1314802 RepID=A0A6A6XRU0_9PLEO|nr:hypothetical protein K505DRAFT_295997 [Melanomma pulvis-pyrius CBS 109.77]